MRDVIFHCSCGPLSRSQQPFAFLGLEQDSNKFSGKYDRFCLNIIALSHKPWYLRDRILALQTALLDTVYHIVFIYNLVGAGE